jgi:hypothetical protein
LIGSDDDLSQKKDIRLLGFSIIEQVALPPPLPEHEAHKAKAKEE